MMQKGRSTGKNPPAKHPFPLFLSLTLFACSTGTIVAVLKNEGSFSLVFGDVLLLEALLMFGIAWVGYLKKDGIRFLPPKKSIRSVAAESWKDRVPGLGEAPFPPRTIPGAEGPDSPDYQRLAAAEDRLRKRILGEDQETEGPEMVPVNGQGFTRSAVLSGLLLLLLALFFEYLVPNLLR